ncbi:hypothetical protein NY08_3345 [Rhodococcus sp. B7740]|nr:hypothetical protein NY08_3345 [Rhodococcus sp. B7740]
MAAYPRMFALRRARCWSRGPGTFSGIAVRGLFVTVIVDRLDP